MAKLNLALIALTALTALTITNALSIFHFDQLPVSPHSTSHSTPDSTYSHISSFLLDLHKDLITIDSVSESEKQISLFLQSYLEALGLTVELQPIPERDSFNVFAYMGLERATKVVLTSHIDTVPPYVPYFIEDGKIYGRGSCDAKASVLAQIKAFVDLMQVGKIQPGDVALLFVVGEEKTAIGMQTLSKIFASEGVNHHWQAVIFGEPTENKLSKGHKGAYGLTLKIAGQLLHSGYPQLGRDSNRILIDILYKIQTTEFPYSPLLGASTVNIGLIDAGIASNVISDHLLLELSIRVAADYDWVESTVDSIIESSGWAQYISLKAVGSGPQVLDYDVPGFEHSVESYGTDIGHLQMANHTKRYLYGPGSITIAHVNGEYVEVESLVRAVADYKRLVEHSLEGLGLI